MELPLGRMRTGVCNSGEGREDAGLFTYMEMGGLVVFFLGITHSFRSVLFLISNEVFSLRLRRFCTGARHVS